MMCLRQPISSTFIILSFGYLLCNSLSVFLEKKIEPNQVQLLCNVIGDHHGTIVFENNANRIVDIKHNGTHCVVHPEVPPVYIHCGCSGKSNAKCNISIEADGFRCSNWTCGIIFEGHLSRSNSTPVGCEVPAFVSEFSIQGFRNHSIVTFNITRHIIFDCDGNGTPSPGMTLMKDGTEICRSENSTLRHGIQMAEPRNSGNYTCIALNAFGGNNATIVVNYDTAQYSDAVPAYVHDFYVQGFHNHSVVKFKGSRHIVFDCEGKGTPWPYMKLLKDGTEIWKSGNYTLRHSIQMTGLQNSGKYTCIAFNALGGNNATIEVNYDTEQYSDAVKPGVIIALNDFNSDERTRTSPTLLDDKQSHANGIGQENFSCAAIKDSTFAFDNETYTECINMLKENRNIKHRLVSDLGRTFASGRNECSKYDSDASSEQGTVDLDPLYSGVSEPGLSFSIQTCDHERAPRQHLRSYDLNKHVANKVKLPKEHTDNIVNKNNIPASSRKINRTRKEDDIIYSVAKETKRTDDYVYSIVNKPKRTQVERTDTIESGKRP
ncbi:uncharacterized protein LOC127870485 [Dreissena polymorpha]|nr:uncharacterized protein LOC127870485 [Dreissena polymorpha]